MHDVYVKSHLFDFEINEIVQHTHNNLKINYVNIIK